MTTTRAQHGLSSALRYWNVVVTVSFLRDALMVQLPSRELVADEGWPRKSKSSLICTHTPTHPLRPSGRLLYSV
jgi:sirohydrochlorin ferrochelatase